MRAYHDANRQAIPRLAPRPRLSPEISELMHMLAALETRFLAVAEAAQ